MEPEKQADAPMQSGKRLEIAVNLAIASMRDAPGTPKAARVVDAEQVHALPEEEVSRLSQVYAGSQRKHTLRDPGWSYVQEVQGRIDQHFQRQRAGRTC